MILRASTLLYRCHSVVSSVWSGAFWAGWLLPWVFHELAVWAAWQLPIANAPRRYVRTQMAFSQHAHFLLQWDGLWYNEIARAGYAVPGMPVHTATAFFPFLPILIRILHGPWPTIAVTQVALLAAFYLLYRFFRRCGLSVFLATLAVWLFAFNPMAIFYSSLYAETWTLLATLTAVELYSSGRTWSAAIVAAIATTTQAPALLVGAFPLVACVFALRRGDWQEVRRALLWGTGVAAGMASYAAFLWVTTGNPLEFSSIQHTLYWGAGFQWPWIQWQQAVQQLRLFPSFALTFYSIGSAMFVFSIGGFLVSTLPRGATVAQQAERRAAALYAALGVLLGLSFVRLNFPFHSGARLISGYFPLYGALAVRLKWLTPVLFVVFICFDLINGTRFLHQWFVQ